MIRTALNVLILAVRMVFRQGRKPNKKSPAEFEPGFVFLFPFSCFLVFLVSQKYTKPSAGVRKQKKTRGSGSTALYFWRRFTSFERVWRKRCSPATDPGPSDRRPGERVGRGVIYQ